MIEGVRGENFHTVAGDLIHENVDTAGYQTTTEVLILRALPVWSQCHGLVGKCDIVEVVLKSALPMSSERNLSRDNITSLCPVEYKKGKRRKFDNDDVQLCAQAICLEEMFATRIASGAIFYDETKRRREVIFDCALRGLTLEIISQLRNVIRQQIVPRAVYKRSCRGCSLLNVCLPKLSSKETQLNQQITLLFEA